MKVTITPETEAEKKKAKATTFVGLRSVAVIGIAYEGDVLRRPYPYSYGDLRDLMREFPVMALDMAFAIIAAGNAADRTDPDSDYDESVDWVRGRTVTEDQYCALANRHIGVGEGI